MVGLSWDSGHAGTLVHLKKTDHSLGKDWLHVMSHTSQAHNGGS